MEKWVRWTTVTEIPSKFYISKISLDLKGLFIILINNIEKKKVIVAFEGFTISNRWTKKTAFLKTVNYLKNQYGEFFLEEGSLFKVENSEYLNWMQEESYGIFETSKVCHYVFLGENVVFEVLLPYEPKIAIENFL